MKKFFKITLAIMLIACFALMSTACRINKDWMDVEEKLIDKGKLLIRKSGTEPKIQVWVWNDDGEQALAIAQEISDVLQNLEGYETSKNVN